MKRTIRLTKNALDCKNMQFRCQNCVALCKKNRDNANLIKNCTIKKTCKITNSVLENCIVLDNCTIENCTLKDCFIFENCEIVDSRILDKVIIEQNCNIRASYIYDNIHIGKNCKIGPFSHIRNSSDLNDCCRIGNYVEVKKSFVDCNTKISHLSYVGDVSLGKNVNIGAGVIFCNYDGKQKHRSVVGDNCFVGSHCTIISPVVIGNNCFVGAGSCLNENLDENMFFLRRPEKTKKRKNKKEVAND